MKRTQSILLYVLYLVIVILVKPVLTHYRNRTFSSFFIWGIGIVIPVICTLIILVRAHLEEYSGTTLDLLFNAFFITVSIFLMIGLRGMTDISLLLPILTEDSYDFIVRIVKKICQ